MALTNGRGVDVAIEVIGNPATSQRAQDIIGPGGRRANIGICQAYEVFKNAAREQAIKIVLTNENADGPIAAGDDQMIRQIVAQVLAGL